MDSDLGKTVRNFAVDLLHQVVSETKDVFFSPTSIAMALSMTLAGAAGKTREQMLKVLLCGRDEKATHEAYANLVTVVNASSQSYQLHSANRLYSMKGYEVVKDFRDTLADKYQSEFKQVDFANDATRIEINNWVEQITHEKIKDVIPEGALDDLTRLVMVNAIYFKGDWADKFEKKATHDAEFFVSPSEKVRVKMMHMKLHFPYVEDQRCQAIEIPYVGESLSMIIVLPKKENGLLNFIKQLNGDRFMNMISNMFEAKAEVFLPKFTLEASYSLPKQLAKMGLVDMFSKNADFSRITNDRVKLYVSDVIHKAFVKVDEEGTEAAAATEHLITLDPVGGSPPPVIFRADHPFLFAIFDKSLGCPLFMGHVIRPDCDQGAMERLRCCPL